MRLLCVICGLLTSLRVCECGKPDCFSSSTVEELVLRAEVVFEGVLEEPRDDEPEPLRVDAVEPHKSIPGAELPQSRIRVHRVWEIKRGKLRKDSVVFVVWSREDKCFRMRAGTRYVLFTQATGDASVLRAVFAPVQSKRAVRKDISQTLCQTCATPKLKKLTDVNVEEGQKVTLQCELLAGGKQTKIQWFQNGIKVDKSETRKIKLKKKGSLSELQLMKVSDSDVGTYTCKAVNSRGEDAQNASVQVIKAPSSTTTSAKTSSHMTRCKEEEKSYCVNGGECLTVNLTPNTTKYLCRCHPGFTGNRCEIKEPVRVSKHEQHHGIEFMEAEELYQKRILTITGICIALLVVGIMCVVAYCKTKKQRQKLHDRLRQSLRKRNAMADISNGSQYPQNHHQPPQSLQLVNQYELKNTAPAQHVIEKETETSFTLNQYTSPSQPSAAITASLSQGWSNKKPDSAVSDTHAISGVQNGRTGTPSQRGRLNATGGGRDVIKNSKETTDSYKDSPYSERYVSTVTTPTRLSPVKLLSPATPSSPPSEMSAPLPSLATSIPSMATSPSGEEERPLLFLTPPRLREKPEPSRAQQLRNSAHYNHGLDEMSPPPSPLHIQEDEQHESMQEDNSVPCAPPTSAPHSPTAMHNSKRTEDQNSQDEQSVSSSESSSSESEAEEEHLVAENTPFLIQNAGVAGMAMLGLELVESSRTNAALRLSPQDDLQSRLASVMANQDPIAV